jgi:hypothetical protein
MRVLVRRDRFEVEARERHGAGALEVPPVLVTATVALGHVACEQHRDRVQALARQVADPVLRIVRAGQAEDVRARRHALPELLRERGQRSVVHAQRTQAVPGESQADPAGVQPSVADRLAGAHFREHAGQPRPAARDIGEAQELVARRERRRAREQEVLDVVQGQCHCI